MAHPATGPISPEEMQRIASLPYGAAQIELRKHDPLFGVETGAVIKWRVRVTARAPMDAYTTVEAASEQEAIDIVSTRSPDSFDWDAAGVDDFEVDEAAPA